MAQASFAMNSGQQASPFSIAQAVSSLSSTANNFHAQSSSSSNSGTSTNPNSTFKVPAHKHAHHLHSIPPREKSTRTLIIDHMLWVHGRTRFAQARAELGMTDRTGGPSSSNYKHRHRPENYEEEEEIDSDGEVVDTLKGRSAPHDQDEDARLTKQDLPLARSLRLRAEGLEKVVTSMLVQLPPLQPIIDDDLSLSSSPKIMPSGQRPRHPHTLPNGVRLRLALGTVINDLFARQSPPQPFRHRRDVAGSPSANRSSSSLGDGSPLDSSPSSSSLLPEALATLSPISAYSASNRNRPMDHVPNHSYGQISPRAMAQGSSSHSPVSPSRQQSNRIHPKRPLKPGSRTRTLYNAGADPETANSPPAFRCPRHLHTGCEICLEVKSGARPPVGGGTGRGRSSSSSGVAFGLTGGGTVTNGSGSTWNSWKGTPIGIAPDGGGVTGWQDGSGIGSGLLRPAVNGTVLRRKLTSVDGETVCGGGTTKLSELIPRFLRLSALVAAELGREVREAKEVEGALVDTSPSDHESSQSPETTRDVGGADTGSPSRSQATSSAQAQDRLYGYALRPSREWYLLLAGLLTRAALQGYLSAGWRGSDAVECLLTVGLGLGMGNVEVEDPDDEFEEFEPDELPSLLDSVKMLFPALRAGAPSKKTHAEEEYELEMDDRLRKFYDIPESTPDLSTHMEDLAWQYPAEPVERAAVRFCEAIAKWRGKPELETYKKKPPRSSLAPSGTASDEIQMTIESLVHSNPTSPTVSNRAPSRPHHHHKPIIELYFLQPNDADHHLSSPVLSPSIATTPTQATYSVSRASFSQHGSPSSMGSSSGMGMNLPRGMNPPSQTSTQAMPPPSTPGMIMGTTSSMWSWMPNNIGGSNKRTRSTDDADTGPRKRLQFQQNPSHGPS